MSEHDETDGTVAPDLDDQDDQVQAVDQVGVEDGPAAEAPLLDDGPADAVDLDTALAQRDEYLALARQVQADFENFRKRAMKQQSDAAAAATARLVESLLPVLDALDSAVLHGVDGVAPVHKQLLDVLTRAGLEIVPTDEVPFDPTIHEAVIHEPAEPGTEGDGHEPRIVEVLRTGYLWQTRTLRAAMVKVRD